MSLEVPLRRLETLLRAHALGLPDAYEDFPLGQRVIKVKGKAFAYLSVEGDALLLSTRLPASRHAALRLPFAEPMRFGMGKAGWVTSRLHDTTEAPMRLLETWIDESYRTVAPPALVEQLPENLETPVLGVQALRRATRPRRRG